MGKLAPPRSSGMDYLDGQFPRRSENEYPRGSDASRTEEETLKNR